MPGVYLRDSHRPVDNPDLGSVCKGVVPFVHEPTTTTRTDRRPVAATRVVAAPATPVHRATGQEAAAKATAAAEVARAKAEQARQRAEQERQDANQRYLDVLVTEHESARTAAVTALGEAREALAVAVKVATERFAGASALAWDRRIVGLGPASVKASRLTLRLGAASLGLLAVRLRAAPRWQRPGLPPCVERAIPRARPTARPARS